MVFSKAVKLFAVGMIASMAVVGSAEAQNAQSHQGFWISGGLGYGSLGCDNCDSREGSVSGDLSLGGTISQRFLLGVGAAAWSKSEDGATLTVNTLDARVRFYPSTSGGFFLTGGVGVGSVTGSAGAFSARQNGVGVIMGLGYDYRVARNTSITPFWNAFAMKNDQTDANVGQIGLAITLH